MVFEWTARAYDEAVDRYSNEHVRADVDMALYGRATYLGMQEFWSSMLGNPNASPNVQAHAEWVNNVEKVVFSTTLDAADWANSRLIRGNIEAEVNVLKEGLAARWRSTPARSSCSHSSAWG